MEEIADATTVRAVDAIAAKLSFGILSSVACAVTETVAAANNFWIEQTGGVPKIVT